MATALLLGGPIHFLDAAERLRRVADPSVSMSSGLHREPLRITLGTETPGATIRFTTNGSAPTSAHGTVYAAPIPIGTTTVLRAAAFRDDLAPSAIATRTFVFPASVVAQTGAGFPATWGMREGRPVPADYEMDPEISGHPAYQKDLLPALTALPSLSIVMEPGDLFGAEQGIYAHPMESGALWERPAAIELLPSNGLHGFQADAGIRIQGGWNRRPEESPKHAFRVVFRKKYGPGKLEAPLFSDPGPMTFDELILRAGCNNSWLHWKSEERHRGDYLRDEWMRDTHAAMGHPAARGRFVHLYLNGLYWGLYNLTERPAGSFVADRFGGKPSDYDVRNGGNLLEGDATAWQHLQALLNPLAPESPLPADLAGLLDLSAFADYMILNLYGANGDWDGASNWYAARRRDPPGPFQFFVWDGERTLEDPTDNAIAYDAENSPPGLFTQLRRHREFRRLFAERARLHLTGSGALTPAAAAARFQALADGLALAIVAESARWGDYRRDAHPYKTGPYELYTRDDHWKPEVRRLVTDYFPRRTAEVIRQFEAAGLWNP